MQPVVLQVVIALTHKEVSEVALMLRIGPVPTRIPPQAPLYQYHGPEPEVPPVTDKVEVIPLQTATPVLITALLMDPSITVTVVLTHEVLFPHISALT